MMNWEEALESDGVDWMSVLAEWNGTFGHRSYEPAFYSVVFWGEYFVILGWDDPLVSFIFTQAMHAWARYRVLLDREKRLIAEII